MRLLLAPGGEFAFIGIGLAAQLALIDTEVASRVLAVVSLTKMDSSPMITPEFGSPSAV